MTDRADAVQNAASIISSYCGRTSVDGPMQNCHHDHTADGQAMVRMVEQYAFPEQLRDIQRKADKEGCSETVILKETIDELEARARVVPAR